MIGQDEEWSEGQEYKTIFLNNVIQYLVVLPLSGAFFSYVTHCAMP
jgi:hypothetical protein